MLTCEMCLLISICSFTTVWIHICANSAPAYNRIPTDLNHLEIPTLCHLTYVVYSAMLWLRWLATSLSPWRHKFIPTEVHVGFVVYTWHWDRFLSEYVSFPIIIILPIPHTHISLICHQSYMILSFNSILKENTL